MTVGTLDTGVRRPTAPRASKKLSPLATVRHIRRDPLGFFAAFARDHDGVAPLPIGFEKVMVLNSPAAFEQVFVSNWRNYRKSDFYNKIRPLFGNGIVTSEGDAWRRQRKLMNPAFHHDSLRRFGEIMREKTAARLDIWRQRKAGDSFDVTADTTELSLAIVMECLFGSDARGYADTISETVDTMLEICERRVWAVPDLHGTALSPLYWRHRRARAALDDVVFDIIDKRLNSGEAKPDLLNMLLDARDAETGEGMTREQLRDEATTLLVTGHESTANTLNWILFELAQRPEIVARLHAELAENCGTNTPSDANLRNLPYMRAVIEETMRLYPPAWTVSRTALEDDVIDGVTVPAGTNVMVSPYVIQRNPRYWPDPERFDPERFMPEQRDARPKFAYIPFGGGPRNCIGSNFAMMELQIAVAMILQSFSLALAPGQTVEREAIISIRPRNGLRLVATPTGSRFGAATMLAAE